MSHNVTEYGGEGTKCLRPPMYHRSRFHTMFGAHRQPHTARSPIQYSTSNILFVALRKVAVSEKFFRIKKPTFAMVTNNCLSFRCRCNIQNLFRKQHDRSLATRIHRRTPEFLLRDNITKNLPPCDHPAFRCARDTHARVRCGINYGSIGTGNVVSASGASVSTTPSGSVVRALVPTTSAFAAFGNAWPTPGAAPRIEPSV